MPIYGKIIVKKRNGEDGSHFLLKTTSCKIGRDEECDIRIQLSSVSKEHCRIFVEDNGEVFLNNLTKVGSTLVNGIPVTKSQPLKHLDVFTVSDRSFRWEFTPESRYWSLVRRPLREDDVKKETTGQIVVNGNGSESDDKKTKPNMAKLRKKQKLALKLMSTKVLKRAKRNKPNPDKMKTATVNINKVIKPQFKKRQRRVRKRNKKSATTSNSAEESFDLANFKTPNIPREVFVSPLTSNDRDLGASPRFSTSPKTNRRSRASFSNEISGEVSTDSNLSPKKTPNRISPKTPAAVKSKSASKVQKKTPLVSRLSPRRTKTPISVSNSSVNSTSASDVAEKQKNSPKISKTPSAASKETPKPTKTPSKKIATPTPSSVKPKHTPAKSKLTPKVVTTPLTSLWTQKKSPPPSSPKKLPPPSPKKSSPSSPKKSPPPSPKKSPPSSPKKSTPASKSSAEPMTKTPMSKVTPKVTKTPTSSLRSRSKLKKSPPLLPTKSANDDSMPEEPKTKTPVSKLTPRKKTPMSKTPVKKTPMLKLTPRSVKTPSTVPRQTQNSTSIATRANQRILTPRLTTSTVKKNLTPVSKQTPKAVKTPLKPTPESTKSKTPIRTSTKYTPKNIKTPISTSKSTTPASAKSTPRLPIPEKSKNASITPKMSPKKVKTPTPKLSPEKEKTPILRLSPRKRITPSSLSKTSRKSNRSLTPASTNSNLTPKNVKILTSPSKSTPPSPKSKITAPASPDSKSLAKVDKTPSSLDKSRKTLTPKPVNSATKERLNLSNSKLSLSPVIEKLPLSQTSATKSLTKRSPEKIPDGPSKKMKMDVRKKRNLKRKNFPEILDGIKRLFQTTKKPDYTNVAGIKRLMQRNSPRSPDDQNLEGVGELFSRVSPAKKRRTNSSGRFANVEKITSPKMAPRSRSMVPVVMDIKMMTPDVGKSLKKEIATRVTRSTRKNVAVVGSPKITRSIRKTAVGKVKSPKSPVVEVKSPQVKKRGGRPPKSALNTSVRKAAAVVDESPVVRRSARNANKENSREKENAVDTSVVIKTPARRRGSVVSLKSVDVEVKKGGRSKKEVSETPKTTGRATRRTKTPAKLGSPILSPIRTRRTTRK